MLPAATSDGEAEVDQTVVLFDQSIALLDRLRLLDENDKWLFSNQLFFSRRRYAYLRGKIDFEREQIKRKLDEQLEKG